MERYKYHIVYQTTNIINNRIYVGMHSTNNLDDGYLGSGWVLKAAIKKYGREAFKRQLLHVFPTRAEARSTEAAIVTQEFIDRPDTYNLAPGGMGVEDQYGANNPMWGKIAHNAKKLKAIRRDGTELIADSIQALSEIIGIDRANIRNLINKQIIGRRGWKVELVS